ncbi:hypothetical protein PC116_g16994 [Phytophthora cactorum]|uniref:Uncharacterized protein n=1 Tax=Phytophthora cactorum TaxID=29920 RepID=A0A329SCC0_9STRA|nr:hypothetical protein C6341_g15560 [Phytophthora cactorum]KAG4234859.1 hypothetical protein PC116_g16994 [Phytophthora cactorum]RAW33252.1 hypothetical protein PC110_g10424 [Phytophthora cactorum]
MDASNTGLCAIHPAAKEFLRVQFDEDERAMIAGNQFSINLREQLSAVFAVLCWWSVVDPDKDVYTDIHPLLD